jgi:hypothetical protein
MRRSIPLACAAFVLVLSCDENLPSGPSTFAAQLRIAVSHDTLVVGDTNAAVAQALDNSGHQIESLAFTWTSVDSSTVGFASPGSPDTSSGRARRLVGKKTGRSGVSIALPDPRFVSSPASRTETVVVGGVRVLTTHDSTLSAINDTGVAVAAGLVRVNGQLVPRAGEGVRWIHQGSHTAVVTSGDTLRYVAKSNGPDTLIATSDFCLAGAKCADTIVARVSQVLTLALSTKLLRSWSFSDSLTPSITLADRRGNGLAGTTIRYVPATSADSAIVRVGAVIGTSNPTTGVMATPRLISVGNGTSKVIVQGVAPDGSTIVATDSLTQIVRQVARYANVEALRALMSATDSIPMKAVARDARGAVIADATVSVFSSVGVPFNAPWAGPNLILNVSVSGVLTPAITGIALPDSNPLAPQVPVVINVANLTVPKADTVKAGHTQIGIPITVFDSTGLPALGAPVAFGSSFGPVPATVVTDINGQAVAVWTPPDSAAYYTLTGVRPATPLATLADSTGRIVVRRSVQVIAGDPDPTKSTVEVTSTSVVNTTGTTTVTVKVRDIFGNIVKTATPADFIATPTRGTFLAPFSCALGVCTATYQAPATAGADSISVQIGGIDIQFSPLTITIT